MITIKTPDEIRRLRIAGAKLARIMKEVAKEVKPGINTKSLDTLAFNLMKEEGGKPALLGFKPYGARYPYPATMCISVNAEVVHGIPGDKVLKDGDVVSLDTVFEYEGVFVDHTVSVPVGKISPKDKELLAVCEQSLYEGIEAIKPGGTTGDIGHAVEQYVKEHKLYVVKGLAGHGVGRAIHEDPYVPNYGKPGKGDKLKPGMVLAIEPMISRGSADIVELADGYTLKMADNSRAAHFEHTVLITEEGAEILTK